MILTKSKVFLYFCLAFIIGIALASFIAISYFLGGIFLTVAIIMIILGWQTPHQNPEGEPRTNSFRIIRGRQVPYGVGKFGAGQRKWELVVLGFCLIFALAGTYRFQAKAEIGANDISEFNEKGKIVFIGIVDDQPERKIENQRIVVKAQFLEVRPPVEVEPLAIESQVVSGKVLITVNKYPEYKYGAELEINGKLKQPKADDPSTSLPLEARRAKGGRTGFDYKQYLAKDDIYSIMYYPEIKELNENKGNPIKLLLFKIKDKFENNLAKIFPEPQASLADGLILGEKATLPKNLLDIFAIVGITHIIALSGFNITIIAEGLRRVFNSFMVHRRWSFWITVIFIIGFIIMTGASASIIRAGIMGILIVLARRAGRLYNIRNALALAAVAMIFINPKLLRFDLGFQLSFLATIGLVYISPIFEKYFQWLPEKFDLRGIGIATMSAQLAVFPLLMFSFGKLSLIAPIANLLILPIIPLAMFLIFLSAMVSFVWIKLGIIFGWLAWLFLTYQIKLAELLAKLPGAAMDIKIGWGWVVAMYIILLIFTSVSSLRRQGSRNNF